jgi:hypothetical protein
LPKKWLSFPLFSLPEWHLGTLRSDKKAATLLGVTASGAILDFLVGWASEPLLKFCHIGASHQKYRELELLILGKPRDFGYCFKPQRYKLNAQNYY